MKRLFILGMLGLLVLASCNNPRKANNRNFTRAIDAYLSVHGKACLNRSWRFPVNIPKSQTSWNATQIAELRALKSAGLVKSSDTSAAVLSIWGQSKPEPVTQYSLTDAGKKYLQPVSGFLASGDSFCYGQEAVDSIVKWTEPGAAGGLTVTAVTYTYRLNNVVGWAQNQQMVSQFPEIKRELDDAKMQDRTVELQLTNKGWDTGE